MRSLIIDNEEELIKIEFWETSGVHLKCKILNFDNLVTDPELGDVWIDGKCVDDMKTNLI